MSDSYQSETFTEKVNIDNIIIIIGAIIAFLYTLVPEELSKAIGKNTMKINDKTNNNLFLFKNL